MKKTKTSKKSRTVALLFSLFLGAFGAHRFYAGKTGSAIAILILTITIIGAIVSSIWTFIDFIMIIAGSFKDSEGKIIKNW